MWYRKRKVVIAKPHFACTIEYDLWAWAIPLLIDIDYGMGAIQLLCFKVNIGWD